METKLTTTYNNTDAQSQETEVDLLKLLRALWRKAWLLLLVGVFGAAGAFAYTYYLVTPLYQASAMMYVNNTSFSVGGSSVSISPSELTAAQSLVDTYLVILESRNTINEVIEQADLSYSYEDLKSMISASAVNSTEVFEVNVTSPDPYEAEKVANTIAVVLPDKIADIVDGSSVRIVDYAVVPATRVSPSFSRNTLLGFLIAVIICGAIIVVREMTDTIVHSEEELGELYNLPVLAVIPDMSSINPSHGKYYSAHTGAASAAHQS